MANDIMLVLSTFILWINQRTNGLVNLLIFRYKMRKLYSFTHISFLYFLSPHLYRIWGAELVIPFTTVVLIAMTLTGNKNIPIIIIIILLVTLKLYNRYIRRSKDTTESFKERNTFYCDHVKYTNSKIFFPL